MKLKNLIGDLVFLTLILGLIFCVFLLIKTEKKSSYYREMAMKECVKEDKLLLVNLFDIKKQSFACVERRKEPEIHQFSEFDWNPPSE